MSVRPQEKPGRPRRPPVHWKDLRGGKYLRKIQPLLRRLRGEETHPPRNLHYDEYVAYLLLYWFTPILTSLRGTQQASELEGVHRHLGLPRFSLGSFSEAGRVFDPELLHEILVELGEEVCAVQPDPRLQDLGLAVTAVDGTLLHAVPKMVWALWLSEDQRAAKLHLEFNLLKGVPAGAALTDGNGNEDATLRERLSANRLYVLDRGYAHYALLDRIFEAHSSFVVRIRNNSVYEVLETRPLGPEAVRAGVTKDVVVRLGGPCATQVHGRRIRLVEIRVRDTQRKGGLSGGPTVPAERPECTILLGTDLLDLEAEVIADLYRLRWQIELFFRWFKKILQADRPLSLSRNGMTIVVYTALIASLLVTLWTGRKPTKRTFEMICFYFSGWASERELEAHIRKLSPVVE